MCVMMLLWSYVYVRRLAKGAHAIGGAGQALSMPGLCNSVVLC